MMGSNDRSVLRAFQGWVREGGSKDRRAEVRQVYLSHGGEFGLPGIQVEKRNAVGIAIAGFGLGRRAEKMVQEVPAKGRFAGAFWAAY